MSSKPRFDLALVASAGLTLLVGSALLATPGLASSHKVEVCHAPPGNPAKRHTISVAQEAAQEHLANHPDDQLGACSDDGSEKKKNQKGPKKPKKGRGASGD